MYPERRDVAHPGVSERGERIGAEDHSSPRSRLHDGAESVVRTSEETAIVDDRTGTVRSRAVETGGPGTPLRTSDERSGASGPAGAYYEDAGVDERQKG